MSSVSGIKNNNSIIEEKFDEVTRPPTTLIWTTSGVLSFPTAFISFRNCSRLDVVDGEQDDGGMVEEELAEANGDPTAFLYLPKNGPATPNKFVQLMGARVCATGGILILCRNDDELAFFTQQFCDDRKVAGGRLTISRQSAQWLPSVRSANSIQLWFAGGGYNMRGCGSPEFQASIARFGKLTYVSQHELIGASVEAWAKANESKLKPFRGVENADISDKLAPLVRPFLEIYDEFVREDNFYAPNLQASFRKWHKKMASLLLTPELQAIEAKTRELNTSLPLEKKEPTPKEHLTRIVNIALNRVDNLPTISENDRVDDTKEWNQYASAYTVMMEEFIAGMDNVFGSYTDSKDRVIWKVQSFSIRSGLWRKFLDPNFVSLVLGDWATAFCRSRPDLFTEVKVSIGVPPGGSYFSALPVHENPSGVPGYTWNFKGIHNESIPEMRERFRDEFLQWMEAFLTIRGF